MNAKQIKFYYKNYLKITIGKKNILANLLI